MTKLQITDVGISAKCPDFPLIFSTAELRSLLTVFHRPN